jgi:CHAT domain-containing protein/tetratricopeptide (TPR) repeat protein
MSHFYSSCRMIPVSMQSIAFYLHLLLILSLLIHTVSPTILAQPQTGTPSSTTQNPPVRRLEVNARLNREMRGGELHTYEITLNANQYLRVSLEQRGSNLALALLAPDGRKISEADAPHLAYGMETILFLADSPGTYKLEVRPARSTAPLRSYEIRIEELRPATFEDKDRISAHLTFSEAEQLFKKGGVDSLEKAIEKYESASRLFQKTGETFLQAMSIRCLAFTLEFGQEPQKAYETYLQALPLLQNSDYKQEPALTLGDIARVCRKIYKYRNALEYSQQALELFRANGNRRKAADMLLDISLVHLGLGDAQKAINTSQESAVLAESEGDRERQAQALNYLGRVYSSLSDPVLALHYFTQALSLIEGRGLYEESTVLAHMGRAHTEIGEHEKALGFFNKAVALMQNYGDIDGEAIVLTYIGQTHLFRGETDKALVNASRALKVFQDTGLPIGESSALNQIGKCYEMKGDMEKALDYYRQALRLQQEMEDKVREAITRYNIANLERSRGNLEEAIAQVEAAIEVTESRRSRVDAEQLRATFLASFQNLYELYITLLMESGKGSEQSLVAAFAVSERARARSLLDLLGKARVTITEGQGAEFINREREAAQKLNERARELTQLLSRKHTEAEVAATRKEIEDAAIELQETRAKLHQANPRYSALTQPQPLKLTEIQQQVVDESSLLLEYSLGKEHSYLFVVAKQSIKTYELPKRAEIEAAARRVYESLTARNQFREYETIGEKKARVEKADADFNQAANALSQMILAPVAQQLSNQRLLVVTDGALQYIPFGVLPLPQMRQAQSAAIKSTPSSRRNKAASLNGRTTYTPLISVHEIVSLPSASTLAVLRKELENRKPAPKTVAVLADPVFDKNDERFKHSQAYKKESNKKESLSGIAQARTSLRPQIKEHPANTLTRSDAAKAKALSSQGQSGSNQSMAQSKKSMLIIESEMTRTARDTDADKDGFSLPRIPFTRREAEAITSLVAASERKEAVDFEASRTTALTPDLSQYRYVHFATHGFLNTAHPELSGIALSMISEDGKEQDGFLRAHEIFNLKLPAELVVLSGCRTGLGKEIRGEGLVGLTRGFMYAGAARVLVSLWDVNDEATAELMSRFYKAMLGKEKLSPAAALKAAQTSMWKDSRWQSPYYWAGFVLQGEPN